MKKTLTFTFILFLLGIIPNLSHSQGTIHDAVFSPDGSMIAVGGTKGVYLYRFDDMVLMDTIQTPNDVHFIRWSPNMQYLIAAHWDDSDKNLMPVYSILDKTAKKNIFDIKDQIQWFGRLMIIASTIIDSASDSSRGLFYFYDKPNKWPLHPNCINFSPDSLYIGLIDDLNQIQIYDISKRTLVRTLNRYDKSPIAIDHKIIAVKPLSENSVELSTTSGGIYQLGLFNEDGYEAIDFSNIGYDTYSMPAFAWTDDRTYALSMGPVWEASTYLNMNFYLCKLNKDYEKMNSSNFKIPETYPIRQRGAFVKNNTLAIMLCHQCKKNVQKEDIEEIRISAMNFDYKMNFTKAMIADRFDPLLMQPFSPDGEYFLLLQDGNLYQYESRTLKKIILLPINNVLN